jgi:fumarate reductase subunit D
MRRRGAVALLMIVAMVVAALAVPAVALADGNSLGTNLETFLRGFAGKLYTGGLAVASLWFLMNRRFTELAVFFCVAIVVGWFVFAPDEVANAAKSIAHQVLP